jgi:hypothetical protein
MATSAQTAANRTNARQSTGPHTPEGKTRAAANSTTHGLFAATNHVDPAEEPQHAAFLEAFHKQFAPEGPIEETLAIETISAAWRLRRCGIVDANLLQSDDPIATQLAVDRARNQAHRLFLKGLAELRRLQTERQLRFELLPESDDPTLVSFRDIIRDLSAHTAWQHAKRRLNGVDTIEKLIDRTILQPDQQPAAAPPPEHDWLRSVKTPAHPDIPRNDIPRNAPCPCNSGEKYKRCCGPAAPPVLNRFSGRARS